MYTQRSTERGIDGVVVGGVQYYSRMLGKEGGPWCCPLSSSATIGRNPLQTTGTRHLWKTTRNGELCDQDYTSFWFLGNENYWGFNVVM